MKNLNELFTPCLILDENKFSKNIERLKSIVDQKNINFRPHLKTAKCIEITKRFSETFGNREMVSTIEEIENKFSDYKIEIIESNLSPGNQLKHYSPNKDIRINVKNVFDNEALLNFGKNNLKSKIQNLNLSNCSDLNEASHNFYNFLNILDKSKCNGIAVAPIPNHGLGKTINDRLKRAASEE